MKDAEFAAAHFHYTGTEWVHRPEKLWEEELVRQCLQHTDSYSAVKIVLLAYAEDSFPDSPIAYSQPALQAVSEVVWECLWSLYEDREFSRWERLYG